MAEFAPPIQRAATSQRSKPALGAPRPAPAVQRAEAGSPRPAPSIVHSLGDLADSGANRTGLPDRLKAGLESLAGISLDDVRVHRNSPRPLQLQAHAFAQGREIHLGPGQERHLPHEAWHLVQQRQGRVRPTPRLGQGQSVNDDAALEREADGMGARALSAGASLAASHNAMPAQSPPAPPTNTDAPVQRVVLHKIRDGQIRYYSSLAQGRTDYPTRQEAEDEDTQLVGNPGNIRHALHSSTTRGQAVPPRRSYTPYSYRMKNSVSAKPDVTDQGPHTVGFAAQEYRLQKRLAKGQHDELAAQVLPVQQFEALMDKERPDEWQGSDHRRRMLLDYHSLHARWTQLHQGGNRSVGSEYHLVTRQIMQMHPYTTYGQNVKSKGNAERSNSRFGTRVLDAKAYQNVKDTEELERYYMLRKDLFHDSDTHSEGEDFSPWPPQPVAAAAAASAALAPAPFGSGPIRRVSSFGRSRSAVSPVPSSMDEASDGAIAIKGKRAAPQDDHLMPMMEEQPEDMVGDGDDLSPIVPPFPQPAAAAASFESGPIRRVSSFGRSRSAVSPASASMDKASGDEMAIKGKRAAPQDEDHLMASPAGQQEDLDGDDEDEVRSPASKRVTYSDDEGELAPMDDDRDER